MFLSFSFCHYSNFFSYKAMLTSVTPAFSAPVLHTPDAPSSTLHSFSLKLHSRTSSFFHFLLKATSVNASYPPASVSVELTYHYDYHCFTLLFLVVFFSIFHLLLVRITLLCYAVTYFFFLMLMIPPRSTSTPYPSMSLSTSTDIQLRLLVFLVCLLPSGRT